MPFGQIFSLSTVLLLAQATLISTNSGPTSSSSNDMNTTIGYHHPEYKRNSSGFLIHYPYYHTLDDVSALETTPDDVIISGFPKSGTTLITAAVGCLLNGTAFMHEGPIAEQKVPFLEFATPALERGYRGTDAFSKLPPGRRMAFSHLPFDLLPKTAQKNSKIIYHTRNPKDGLISLYYHHLSRPLSSYNGTLDDMVKDYVTDTVPYGPYFDHLANCWSHRNQSNILFTSYEKFVKEPTKALKEVAEFLGVSVTDEMIAQIAEEIRFEKMKDNPRFNRIEKHTAGIFNFTIAPFMRQGTPGSWKKTLSPDMVKELDEWIGKNLKREDLADWQELRNFLS